MRLLLNISLLLLLVAPRLEAQVVPFRNYSIENGLSEAVVNDMIQDENGYIWIATGYGLNRFDGINFQNYYSEDGLLDNKIFSLYESDDGRIWVGTRHGVNVIEDDSIRTLPELEGLQSSSIISIFEDSQGDLWFGTDGEGAWYLNTDGVLTQYAAVHGLAGNRVRAITEDREGALWFATRDGLTRLYNGNFRTFTSRDGLPENRLRDMVLASDGSLWIATRAGLSHYADGQFHNYTVKDGLVNNRIQAMSLDNRGGLWLGTEEGVSYFRNGTFRNYTSRNGMSNQIIYSTLFDREQNIWFGTYGGGISCFLGEKFTNFTEEHGLPNNVITSFTEDDGDLWISTYGGGLSRYDGKQLHTVDESDGLIDDKVYTLYRDRQGRMLIGTRWGLSIYQNGHFINYPESELPYRQIRAIRQDIHHDDVYWLGTYGEGLVRFEGDSLSRLTEDDGLASNTVMSIEQDKSGTLWMATYGGVSRYRDGSFRNYTIADGLPNNGVLDLLLARDGTVWIATFGGLAHLKDGKVETITSADGILSNVCYFIDQDRNGTLWVGTNKGVIRLDPQKYFRQKEEGEPVTAFKLLTADQGLVANETNAGAVYSASDGYMWFGTVSGASRFNPRLDRASTVPPRIHIEGLQVAGREQRVRQGHVFGNDRNNIRIDYIGISQTAPKLVTYEYRLKDIERKWQTTMQRSVRYTALPPGEYTFQVKARSAGGVWSRETAALRFSILAPFWLRWWFLLLVGLAIAVLVYFVYHFYRVKKMMEMERMRVRIASDLHDDVGSSLTEIALQTDFLQTSKLSDEVKNSLLQIGTQSRKIVSSLDDIVWSIDARNDSMGDLTDRMQDYANNILLSRQIKVHYDFDELDSNTRIPVEMRENLYLIFKEAINNIGKHSDADRVDIMLKNEHGRFEMRIHDNGSGKDGARRSGHGLRNMQMRGERIHADVRFKNSDGFTVVVEGKGL